MSDLSRLLGLAEAHPNLAGWAQAVASVIAIGVAIMVPACQAAAARRALARERALKAKSMATAIHPDLVELRQDIERIPRAWDDFQFEIANGHQIYAPGAPDFMQINLPAGLQLGVEQFYVLGDPAAPDVLRVLRKVRGYGDMMDAGTTGKRPLLPADFRPVALECLNLADTAIKSVLALMD